MRKSKKADSITTFIGSDASFEGRIEFKDLTSNSLSELNDIIEVTPIASIYGGFITIGITDESGAIFAVVQYDLENHDPITFQLEDEWYVPGAEYIVFANYENSHAELTIYASENGPKPISKVSELTLDPLPISINREYISLNSSPLIRVPTYIFPYSVIEIPLFFFFIIPSAKPNCIALFIDGSIPQTLTTKLRSLADSIII